MPKTVKIFKYVYGKKNKKKRKNKKHKNEKKRRSGQFLQAGASGFSRRLALDT
jgi:hypothetical protein